MGRWLRVLAYPQKDTKQLDGSLALHKGRARIMLDRLLELFISLVAHGDTVDISVCCPAILRSSSNYNTPTFDSWNNSIVFLASLPYRKSHTSLLALAFTSLGITQSTSLEDQHCQVVLLPLDGIHFLIAAQRVFTCTEAARCQPEGQKAPVHDALWAETVHWGGEGSLSVSSNGSRWLQPNYTTYPQNLSRPARTAFL